MTSHRIRVLLLAAVASLCTAALAIPQSLTLERHGDHLRVTSPQFHFLTGRAVDKLRNGSTVTYVLTLIAAQEHSRKPAFLLQKRFVISFDLWEEKYSVVQKIANSHSASRLNAAAAEEWCLENMPIPVGFVPERQPFMVRLDCSIEEDEEKENGDSHPGLTLTNLIDVFSRKKQPEPLHLEAMAGPFRLEHLKSVK